MCELESLVEPFCVVFSFCSLTAFSTAIPDSWHTSTHLLSGRSQSEYFSRGGWLPPKKGGCFIGSWHRHAPMCYFWKFASNCTCFARNPKHCSLKLWDACLISRGAAPTVCCHIFITDPALHQFKYFIVFCNPLNIIKWKFPGNSKWLARYANYAVWKLSCALHVLAILLISPVSLNTERLNYIWAHALVA